MVNNAVYGSNVVVVVVNRDVGFITLNQFTLLLVFVELLTTQKSINISGVWIFKTIVFRHKVVNMPPLETIFRHETGHLIHRKLTGSEAFYHIFLVQYKLTTLFDIFAVYLLSLANIAMTGICPPPPPLCMILHLVLGVNM